MSLKLPLLDPMFILTLTVNFLQGVKWETSLYDHENLLIPALFSEKTIYNKDIYNNIQSLLK